MSQHLSLRIAVLIDYLYRDLLTWIDTSLRLNAFPLYHSLYDQNVFFFFKVSKYRDIAKVFLCPKVSTLLYECFSSHLKNTNQHRMSAHGGACKVNDIYSHKIQEFVQTQKTSTPLF